MRTKYNPSLVALILAAFVFAALPAHADTGAVTMYGYGKLEVGELQSCSLGTAHLGSGGLPETGAAGNMGYHLMGSLPREVYSSVGYGDLSLCGPFTPDSSGVGPSCEGFGSSGGQGRFRVTVPIGTSGMTDFHLTNVRWDRVIGTNYYTGWTALLRADWTEVSTGATGSATGQLFIQPDSYVHSCQPLRYRTMHFALDLHPQL